MRSASAPSTHPAPGTYAAFGRLTDIPEEERVPPAEEMIQLLLQDHDTITRNARRSSKVAEQHNDQATVDLLSERMAPTSPTDSANRSSAIIILLSH